eukprot:scaffold3490_cov347-Prasinococcus_capsulatus_cf.AAC.4
MEAAACWSPACRQDEASRTILNTHDGAPHRHHQNAALPYMRGRSIYSYMHLDLARQDQGSRLGEGCRLGFLKDSFPGNILVPTKEVSLQDSFVPVGKDLNEASERRVPPCSPPVAAVVHASHVHRQRTVPADLFTVNEPVYVHTAWGHEVQECNEKSHRKNYMYNQTKN